MLFHCTKGDCRFWGEGAAMPDACPRCGGALTAGERAKMSGDDWCALGVFWMEQDGAEEKAVSCFRRAARLGSGGWNGRQSCCGTPPSVFWGWLSQSDMAVPASSPPPSAGSTV